MLLHLTQNLKCILNDILTENIELKQQLLRKEAELTRAEETIRRKQQQILEMVSIIFIDTELPLSLLYRERLSGMSRS